jgi:hypothetical protein
MVKKPRKNKAPAPLDAGAKRKFIFSSEREQRLRVVRHHHGVRSCNPTIRSVNLNRLPPRWIHRISGVFFLLLAALRLFCVF